MSEKFIRAEEVAEIMEISVPYAYKIMRSLTQRAISPSQAELTVSISTREYTRRNAQ